MKQTKKVLLTLSAVLMTAAAAMPAAAARYDRTMNYLNVQIAPIDDNYASTDYIHAIFVPDNGEETLSSRSCSGKVAATNFLDITSGTVSYHKKGYHTEPESWHVDTNHFDKQTLQFTLIPDDYTGVMRAAEKPTISFDEVDTNNDGSFIDPIKRLILKTTTPDAAIHYTTDGSEPGYESPLYTGPIRLESDATFKAIAVKAGYVKSPVMEYKHETQKKEAEHKAQKAAEESRPDPIADSTAEVKDTVKLYFMTGSSLEDPGEVFAEFDVRKNARKNKVTLANTIKTLGRVPEKEGAVFSYWKERSLNDTTKMGNRINGIIWTNDTDQYLYAQYKKTAQ